MYHSTNMVVRGQLAGVGSQTSNLDFDGKPLPHEPSHWFTFKI